MTLWRNECLKRGFGSSAAFPLLNGTLPFGAIVLVSHRQDAFDAGELTLLTELAADISYGVNSHRLREDHSKVTEQLQHSMEATISAIATMAESRDTYTAGHQRRDAKLAVAIAGKLGLSRHRIHGLRLGSIIHDVGKIALPAEILNKPGKLSTLEYEFIKQHVDAGYQVVKDIDFPWPIAQMILQHHERLDGSGYPNGLQGVAILQEARIIAVADIVDAMHSFRPYRAALGIDVALNEIITLKGTQYDPDAVDACVELFRDEDFSFE